MSGAVDVCIVTSVGLVLNGGSVDGDTSGLLFRGLVDLAVFDVLGCVLGSEVLGNGGGQCGLSVVDVSDGAHCLTSKLPLTCDLERSNLAKPCMTRCVSEYPLPSH